MRRFLCWFIILFISCACICSLAEDTEDTSMLELDVTEYAVNDGSDKDGIDVALNVDGHWNDDGGLSIDIETNLPDETELQLTVSRGDVKTEYTINVYKAQTKVKIMDGKAISKGLFDKGDRFSGQYDLSISMIFAFLQTDNVRAVIGESGEHLYGIYVPKEDEYGNKVVDANFVISIEDDTIKIEPSQGYQFTIFNDLASYY